MNLNEGSKKRGINDYDKSRQTTEEMSENIAKKEELMYIIKKLKGELETARAEIIEKTERIKELEQRLAKDELTGLENRGILIENVNKHINKIERERGRYRRIEDGLEYTTLSIAFIDIDNFKKINDTYGHNFGNIILKEVAEALKNNTREFDIVSRWGGEEFVIALLGANEEAATKRLEQIREVIKAISKKYIKDRPGLEITVSIGVKEYEKGLKTEDLVDMSDKMMYFAKKTGKDMVVSYNQKNKETR